MILKKIQLSIFLIIIVAVLMNTNVLAADLPFNTGNSGSPIFQSQTSVMTPGLTIEALDSTTDTAAAVQAGTAASDEAAVAPEITTADELVEYALGYVGYDYVYGGSSPSRGFDCSGFTTYIYKQFGYTISRTASQQYRNNGESIAKTDIKPGDLLFFHTFGSGISHVGIYIGNGQFVHAANSRTGVIISTLDAGYWCRAWVAAKRMV
ncbi:C40 family peptidase [Oscillospiraceae bacterium CM]|nr:C40 family peptidase [Oscillospiraceae bacterium CM]